MIKEILTKDSLEEYFSEDEKLLPYFMDEFLEKVLKYILIQPIIFGNDGDEIGLQLLFYIFKLFIKFHKNSNYSQLFKRIRYIFYQDHGSNQFYTNHKYQDDEKKYSYYNFNQEFCKGFEKNSDNKFNIGDEIDFLLDNTVMGKNDMEKIVWLRGRIKNIEDDKYIIEYFEDQELEIPKNNHIIFKLGTKTPDWEWRTNLKKYDVVDCYDRCRWYPATVVNVYDSDENNGYKKIEYDIAFRLYTEHFKNLEDENDTYDKHIDIWKSQYAANPEPEIKTDDDNEKYVGDGDNCSERIIFYSKRIQKFNTYSAVQQKYLSNGYSNNEDSKINKMTEKLKADNSINIDEYYNYEINGKKNYILGKNADFSYYYARLLKMMEKENVFEEFIEILKNEPNTEEVYNIFFILTYCFPYLHKYYFKENSSIIKNSLINYINGLKEKELRNIPKDLIEIVSNLLYKVNENDENKDDSENTMDLYDEITLTFSLKTIKTNLFERRLQGIKALNEFIEKNEKKNEILKKIIGLVKQNNIISDIFGANYHSQIISKSKDIIKLLLIENEINEEDIKLIWSCTKRGDLEAKLTILKLLSELAPYLKENYIEMLLNNVITNVDKKINKDEVELVYNLSTQGENNDKNIEHCCEYLCQCLLISNDSNIKKSPILEKLLEIVEKDSNFLCSSGIMDYSLLVAKISLNNDEIKCLFGMDHRRVTEAQFLQMIGQERTTTNVNIIKEDKENIDNEGEIKEKENLIDNEGNDKIRFKEGNIASLKKYMFPSLKADIVYIMSIIDYFQLFTLQKNLENKYKKLRKGVKKEDISSIPPDEYKLRFIEFVKQKTDSEDYLKKIYDPQNKNDF